MNDPTIGDGEAFSKYKIIYMDDFVDSLLREEVIFGISLPHLPKRYLLGEKAKYFGLKHNLNTYLQYKSPIEDEFYKLNGIKKESSDNKKLD